MSKFWLNIWAPFSALNSNASAENCVYSIHATGSSAEDANDAVLSARSGTSLENYLISLGNPVCLNVKGEVAEAMLVAILKGEATVHSWEDIRGMFGE